MGIERLDYGSPEGSKALGLHREVISGQGATRTLLAVESGALCLFDKADGIIYTLPAPVVGLQFDFVITVAGTSVSYSIDTDAATTFIGGGVGSFSTAVAEGGDSFDADIGATVSCDFDSALTGRLEGTAVNFTCISSTVWACSGNLHGVGALATPFA